MAERERKRRAKRQRRRNSDRVREPGERGRERRYEETRIGKEEEREEGGREKNLHGILARTSGNFIDVRKRENIYVWVR